MTTFFKIHYLAKFTMHNVRHRSNELYKNLKENENCLISEIGAVVAWCLLLLLCAHCFCVLSIECTCRAPMHWSLHRYVYYSMLLKVELFNILNLTTHTKWITINTQKHSSTVYVYGIGWQLKSIARTESCSLQCFSCVRQWVMSLSLFVLFFFSSVLVIFSSVCFRRSGCVTMIYVP